MDVTVQLRPEVSAHAMAQAAARGLSLEAYLANLLEQAISPATAKRLSLEEFEAGLDALAEGGENLPVLSDEAVSRAGIYKDHD